jgi:hypothetical protein
LEIGAIDTSKAILVEEVIIYTIYLRAMIRAGDREYFKRFLISYAQNLHDVYQMIGPLFEVYRDQSKPLSETIRRLAQCSGLLFKNSVDDLKSRIRQCIGNQGLNN